MYSKADNILASQQFNQINVSSLSSGYQQFHMIASSFFRHFTNQTILIYFTQNCTNDNVLSENSYYSTFIQFGSNMACEPNFQLLPLMVFR